MSADAATMIPVLDFRRHGMVLQWHTLGGTWTAFDNPPPLVHGIALIRPAAPNICLYASAGGLRLQIGSDQYALSDENLRIRCRRAIASFGFRRHFSIESGQRVLFSYSYWSGRGEDFFRWIAGRAKDPDWLRQNAPRWSDGVAAAVVRGV